MPIYEVKAPDGSILEIQGPEGATDAQLINTAAAYYRQREFEAPPEQVEQAAPKERTWGEAASDLGASLLSGTGSLAQIPGQLGMLAGIYKPEEADTGLQGMGRELEKYGQSLKSPELLAKEQARAKKVSEADGILDEFVTAVKETALDPALMTSFFAEQVPNLVGSMGAGMLTKAGLKVALRGATEEVLQKSAVRGMVGTNAAMQGADVGADTYENLYARLTQDGMDPDKAAEIALDKARMAAIEAAAISVGTTMLPGGTTIERALVGRGLPRAGGMLKGFAGEALSEGMEEGGGKLAANIQEAALYPETDIFKGVGEAAGMGALMGGAFGGVGGATLRGETARPPVPPEALPPTEEVGVPPAKGEEERIREMEEEEERRRGINVPEPPPVETPPVEPPVEGVPPVEPAPPVEPIPPVEPTPPVEPPVEGAPPVEPVPPVEVPPVEEAPPPVDIPTEGEDYLHPVERAMIEFNRTGDNRFVEEVNRIAGEAGVTYHFTPEGRIDLSETKVNWNDLRKTRNAETLLAKIRDYVPLDTREIIDRIAPFVKKIPVSISNADVTSSRSPYYGWQGVHILRGMGKGAMHNIELFSKSRFGNSIETITHELVHGATVRNYYEGKHYNEHPNRGDKKFASASKDLDELASFLIDNHGKDVSFFRNYIKPSMSAKERTSVIARELLSWGTTNRETQEQLKKIKLPSGKSAWTKFVEMMRNLLQIPASETNALTKIIELQDRLTGGVQAKPYTKPRGRRVSGEVATPAVDAVEYENLRRWFGNSKIKNEDGSPMRMYHGTFYVDENGNPITSFRTKNGAVFLSPDPNFANKFAMNDMLWNQDSQMAPPENAHVIPVYVKAENPFDFQNPKHINQVAKLLEDSRDRTRFKKGAADGNWQDIEDFIDSIKEAGFDSAFISEQGRKNIAVFDPKQIKSVFNEGTFDPESAVINASVQPTRQTVTGKPINAPIWNMAPMEERSGIQKLLDDGVYQYVDKFVDLKKIIQAINKTSKKLVSDWDAYMRETLYHNRVAYQTNDFLNNGLKPLAQEMVARNVSEEELNAYLLARHAEEYNNAINERNDRADLQHRGSGVHTLVARAYLNGASAQEVQRIKDLFAANKIELNKNEMALLNNLPKMTDAKRKSMEALAKRVDNIIAETQKIAVNGGLEKQATIDYWRDKYQNYVPLKRTQEELDFAQSQTGMGHGFSTKAGLGRAATGSLKTVENILSNIILQRDMAIVKAEKARIGRALYAMALQHPNPSFWLPVNPNASIISKANDLLIEIMRNKEKLAGLNQKIQNDIDSGRGPSANDLQNAQELADKIAYDNKRHEQMAAEAEKVKAQIVQELVDMGLDPAEIDSLIREPQGAWYNPKTGKVEYRTNNYLRSSQNVVAVPINGETRYIFFNPGDERARRLVNSLKGSDVEQLGKITSTAAKFTRWIASVNTQYNPFFGIVNMIRDVQGAQLNLSSTPLAGKQWEIDKRIPGAVATIFRSLRSGELQGKYAAEWSDFQKRGGPTGLKDMLVNIKKNESLLSKQIEILKEAPTKAAFRKGTGYVFDLMSDFNDTMENAVRLAAFIEAKQKFSKTMSPETAADKAAELAKNLTVNFNRKGAKSQFVNSWWAFFNAAIQGSARMYETLSGPAGKKIMASLTLLGVMQQLMLSAAGFDDDDPPEFVREKNIVIPTGDGKYLSWPMPLGFNFFVNFGRLAMSSVESGGKNLPKNLSNFVNVTADAFSPLGGGSLVQVAAPTILDPAVALYGNVDAFGRPIYREDRPGKPVPGYLRSTEGSTGVSKFIAEALNRMSGGTEFQKGEISPTADEIDYIAGQIGGGTFREARKVAEAVKATATGEDIAPYRRPLVGRFTGDTGSDANVRNKFYSNSNELAGYEEEIKGRASKGRSSADFIEKHPEARLYPMANTIETEISNLNKMRKQMIERNASKEELKRINDKKIELMRRFNTAYDEAKK